MRRGLIGVVLGVTVVGWLAVTTPVAAGAAATVGAAVITKPSQATPLDAGGSATLYGVWLPDNARCSGDTEHQEYHIFSFLFRKGISPTDVSFKTGVPAGFGTDGRLGLFADGEYVGALNTAPGSGEVVGLPESYTWTRLTPKYLFTTGQSKQTYEGGIACANKNGVVTNYWGAQIVFTASKTDPGGFTWSVPKASQVAIAGSDGSHLPIGVVLLIVAVALALGAVVMNRRRKVGESNVDR
jgi:hypothetical protein